MKKLRLTFEVNVSSEQQETARALIANGGCSEKIACQHCPLDHLPDCPFVEAYPDFTIEEVKS